MIGVADEVVVAMKRVSDAVTRLQGVWMRRGLPFDGLSEAIQEFNDASAALNEALWEAPGEPDD